MKLYPWLLTIIISLICLQTSADIIVTTNADNPLGPITGEITLRDAINLINAGSADNIIAFAPNVTTIHLLVPLPTVSEYVIIDGLATTHGTMVQPGDCSVIPSPIDNVDTFIAALRVTIDGSNIPSDNTSTQAGLFFVDGSQDSIVRGIHIKNISGTSDSPLACGICAKEIDINITVECCMVDTIFSKNNQVIPTKATGLEHIAIISKSYIRNVKSAPINAALEPTITKTGPAYGVDQSFLVTDSRIEYIESGSILNTTEIPSNQDILISSAAGIFSTENLSGSSNENIVIHNCSIAHIKGGSALLTTPAEVLFNTVSGISIETNVETLVEDNCICDVQMGSATISNENNLGSEINTTLTTEGLFGITVKNTASNTYIRNNIVQSISHGPTEINSTESVTSLSTPIGIFSESIQLIIENNSISSLFGGCHITTGECSSIRASSGTISDNSIGVSGIVAVQGSNARIATTKNDPVCPTPESGSDPLILLCSNQVNTVSGGTLIAAGEGSTITNSGSIGAVIFSEEAVANNNNNITNITGANLYTKAPASTSELKFGTKGLFASCLEIEACNNTISFVQEGGVQTTLRSTHFSNEGDTIFESTPPVLVLGFESPAETAGIAIQLLSQSDSLIVNNQIKNVTGSQPTGSGTALATIGSGISLSPPKPLSSNKSRPSSLYNNKDITKQITQCGSNLTEINLLNNSISAITSHITRPAYGIFSSTLENTSLIIEDNNIDIVCGGGAALSQTINGNINTIINQIFCSEGTEIFNTLILTPSILPYDPTSGIYLLESDCAIISNNNIQKVGKIEGQARGITSTASNDVEIFENSISHIKGPGIFIGGAPVLIGSESSPGSVLPSASVRNVMYSNKTFKNTGKGIELGLSNWSNALELLQLLLGTAEIETETEVGNHDQAAPEVLRVVCNSNGTITLEARLIDPNNPNSDFIIQFFTNSTNNIPHGETPISNFYGSEFIMTTMPYGTNGVGIAQKTFTFIPLAEVKNGDNITAHVTLLTNGSEDIGDTSEFGVETKSTPGYSSLNKPKPSSFCFNKIMSRP